MIYPKISIIIPIYNVERFVIRCLDSVSNQTYKGYLECILVNDCSSDRSMYCVNDWLKSYQGTINFRLFHHDINKGLSEARNTGIIEAIGDYIYFLDSDDTITPNCITYLCERAIIYDPDFVIGRVVDPETSNLYRYPLPEKI